MKTRSSSLLPVLSLILALLPGVSLAAHAPQAAAIAMIPRLTIAGTVGSTYQIQYCTDLNQQNWVVLTNILINSTTQYFIDESAPSGTGRFYRVVRYSPEGMVLIPSGSFTMGDGFDGDNSTLPLHQVFVSEFFMDRLEVTKALWDTVKTYNGGNGYTYENAGAGKAPAHPVYSVNWRDCVKWCNARSEMEGRTPSYYNESSLTTVYRKGTSTPFVKWDANGYRLPTEAEWERAAQGGLNGQRFPWGNSITWSIANYYGYPLSAGGYAYDLNTTSGYNPAFHTGTAPYTSPSGSFSPNAFGLHDMAGNVWEWCWDIYGSYPASAQTNPHGSATGSDRVYRGGSWASGAFLCRVAGRYYSQPGSQLNSLGFRTVISAP